MAPKTFDFSDHPFVQLQQARKKMRHAAHVYAHTKKGSRNYEDAADALDKAAMAFTLCAALVGSRDNPAAPANGPARDAWEKAIDPEPET